MREQNYEQTGVSEILENGKENHQKSQDDLYLPNP